MYFSIIGEPPIKMLRYQQQYSFFDAAKIGDVSVRFIHLGQEALDGGLGKVLEAIVQELETTNPAIVVVDSFRAMVRGTLAGPVGVVEVTDFMQRLALVLTTYEATTFLLGEYAEGEHDSAVFTVADGLLWLSQAIDRNSVVRKLQVVKMRGQGQIPGLHTARITDDGFTVFPRIFQPEEVIAERPLRHRLKTGVAGLDELMGGGVPHGYSVLVAGPSGSGKTVLSNQFIVEGVRNSENGIVAVFEKRPNDYLQTTPRGEEFEKLVREKRLEVLYMRPLDLSIDETLLELRNAVKRLGAERAVIDSLSGLELALAPTFREDFRESLYRMMGALTGLGVTVMATVELADSYVDLNSAPKVWSPKSGEREVPMPDVLVPYFTGARFSQKWVFPSVQSRDRFAFWPSRKFDRARDAAGLKGGPHKLRHTFASHFLRRNPDLFLLARIMGHSHVSVTELYSHLVPGYLDKARDVVTFDLPTNPAPEPGPDEDDLA